MVVKQLILISLLVLIGLSQYFIEYSQYFEGEQLQKYFQGVENGTFVQIGGFDPFWISNTMSLYLKGWTGVVVEANPHLISGFNKIRPEQINLNIAIGQDNQYVTLYQMSATDYSSISSNVKQNQIKTVPNIYVKAQIQIPSYGLGTLCEKYYLQRPLFMTLDIQGYASKALITNNWTNPKCRPQIILSQESQYNQLIKEVQPQQILIQNNYIKGELIKTNRIFIANQVLDKYQSIIQAGKLTKKNITVLTVYTINNILMKYFKFQYQPKYYNHYNISQNKLHIVFARENQILVSQTIRKKGRLSAPALGNRPIVIFNFNPLNSEFVVETDNYVMSKIDVQNVSFYYLKIFPQNQQTYQIYIFDHEYTKGGITVQNLYDPHYTQKLIEQWDMLILWEGLSLILTLFIALIVIERKIGSKIAKQISQNDQ